MKLQLKAPKLDRRLLLIALATLLLAGFLGTALYAFPGPGGGQQGSYAFVSTPASQARTAAGDCYDPNASVQKICVELCFVTLDGGHAFGQGEFICAPPSS